MIEKYCQTKYDRKELSETILKTNISIGRNFHSSINDQKKWDQGKQDWKVSRVAKKKLALSSNVQSEPKTLQRSAGWKWNTNYKANIQEVLMRVTFMNSSFQIQIT